MLKFFTANILPGTVLTIAVFFCYTSGTGLERIELKYNDAISRAAFSGGRNDDVAILKDGSGSGCAVYRENLTKVMNLLSSSGSVPVSVAVLYRGCESKKKADEELIADIAEEYERYKKEDIIKETEENGKPHFLEAISGINPDAISENRLYAAMKRLPGTIIPFSFTTGRALARPEEMPAEIKKSSALPYGRYKKSSLYYNEGIAFSAPAAELTGSATWAGFDNIIPDGDGKTRFLYPFIIYNGRIYPSVPLLMAAAHMKAALNDILYLPGQELKIKDMSARLNGFSALKLSYPPDAASEYTFTQLFSGKIPPGTFKNKMLILSGGNSPALDTVYGKMTEAEYIASAAASVLRKEKIHRPENISEKETAVILAAGLLLVLLFPHLNFKAAFAAAAVTVAALLGAEIYAFIKYSVWIKMTYPAVLVSAGFILISAQNFFNKYEKRKSSKVKKTDIRDIKQDPAAGKDALSKDGKFSIIIQTNSCLNNDTEKKS